MRPAYIIARQFWPHVRKDGPELVPKLGPCWLWTGPHNPRGYGTFRCKPGERIRSAHRASFWLAFGYLPTMVTHRCDNPPCVRPEHLRAGDARSNAKDARDRGRTRPTLKHLDPFNVLAIRAMHRERVPIVEISRIMRVTCTSVLDIVEGVIYSDIR